MPKPIGVDESAIALDGIAPVDERPAELARNVGRDLISLLRPGQWPKNLLAVSVPLLDLDVWRVASLWRMLCAVLSVGFYLLYVRTEAPLGGYSLAAAVLTAPLALFGVFRYLQMVLVQDGGDNPVRMLLRDPALVINSMLMAVVSGGFLLAAHIT